MLRFGLVVLYLHWRLGVFLRAYSPDMSSLRGARRLFVTATLLAVVNHFLVVCACVMFEACVLPYGLLTTWMGVAGTVVMDLCGASVLVA